MVLGYACCCALGLEAFVSGFCVCLGFCDFTLDLIGGCSMVIWFCFLLLIICLFCLVWLCLIYIYLVRCYFNCCLLVGFVLGFEALRGNDVLGYFVICCMLNVGSLVLCFTLLCNSVVYGLLCDSGGLVSDLINLVCCVWCLFSCDSWILICVLVIVCFTLRLCLYFRFVFACLCLFLFVCFNVFMLFVCGLIVC